jgi:hypothetical protein
MVGEPSAVQYCCGGEAAQDGTTCPANASHVLRMAVATEAAGVQMAFQEGARALLFASNQESTDRGVSDA